MRNRNLFSLALVIPLLMASQAVSWQDPTVESPDSSARWRLLKDARGSMMLDAYVRQSLDIRSNMLPSSDGQYLAQDQAELQTYYDLGMQYQFLESPAIRRQLKLPEEQGLLVSSVTAGKGGEKTGLLEGDLILSVGSTPVDTQYDFVIEVKGKRGESAPVEIRRDGVPVILTLQLEPIDPATLQAGSRWIIGVHVDTASDALQSQLQSAGVVILELTENAPAINGGMKIHDVITRINGSQISSPDDLRKIVGEAKGQSVRVEFYRGGKLQSLDLTPIQEPEQEAASGELTLRPYITHLEPGGRTIGLDLLLQRDQIAVDADVSGNPGSEAPSDEDKFAEILERINQLTRDVQELKEQLK